MFNRSMTCRKGGAWTKVAIFISLYALLLESLTQWAIVLYLYAVRRVDAKMTPSLIIALVASFLTVPLVALHSLLAWQYNRIIGFAGQKAFLHAACTYILRLTILVWVAASAAGLVLVAQQTLCLADDGAGNFWKIGISCVLHRVSVIVSIVSFMTVSLFFCSRELCERPYDVSLLGVYRQGLLNCDGSILSGSSLESENSLKNDIYHVCRRPDITYGRDMYQPSGYDAYRKSAILQQPIGAYMKPHLKLDTRYEGDNETLLSGTTLSPTGTYSKKSFGDTTSSDIHSYVSRTPTKDTSKSTYEPYRPAAAKELPGTSSKSGHKRHKSSVSSLRRFLPKVFALPLPLSADPQIRALADPNTPTDVEKQAVEVERPPTPKREYAPGHPLASAPVERPPPAITAGAQSNQFNDTRRRTMTMNSGDAPEVVLPESLNVHRSNTSYTAPIPRTYSNPHQTTFHPLPPPPTARPPQNPLYRGHPAELDQTTLINTRHNSGRQSQLYRFEPNQIPRYTQSQYTPQQTRQGRRTYNDPHRRMASLARRNDVEIVYSSTRRPRSNTCGGIGSAISSPLDCIRETGTSVDETRANVFSDANTYRGTNRTSSGHYY
ncbi:hypothetical protein BO70DRAFT_353312 [Aspergillus heteromorphus CBS 117.55]|uniref:Uncharacterized protein n=1 Tax=Aspergillus heteromorphus CBS 117.55 TaxID=1448321 RepID=A0A317W2T0_9EURO|nr:uncharacterized protein BO70DRAFT_353312 [Aspergillus heteromorphus CBS 117.55]PWY79582.1 hypothetical protein BO70DRAFT_353312 [Aspergillus heteromorphus CBS 117.55]